MSEKGYTLIEVLVAAAIIIGIVGIGLGMYVVAHFVAKFW